MAIKKMLINVLSISNLAYSQSAGDYKANAEASFNALQTWYNTTSGLWNTCGWWNGANCMTAIADLVAVDPSYLSQAEAVFSTTYSKAPAYNPATQVTKRSSPGFVQTIYGNPPQRTFQADDPSKWLNSCYGKVSSMMCFQPLINEDDNAWWALAWIAAYDLTQNNDYLDTAQGIFTNLSSAWPTTCNNGGIYWCSTSSYVNAIANELFLSVAAHLANRVPSQKTFYVDWAQRQWSWFQSVNLINSAGVIVDGLTASCEADQQATAWSYNQGVVLGGLVELAKADPDNVSSYLDSANAIANAAIANLTDSQGIIHDVCERDNSCAPDGTQFKGIFMRNLLELHRASPSDRYKQLFKDNAQSIWTYDRDSANQLSLNWAGPFVQPANASTHSSAMDAITAALASSS